MELRIQLSKDIVIVTHSRPNVKTRSGTQPPSMNDVLGTVCCWSEEPERMKNILLQLPDIHDVVIERKEKS